MDDDNIVEVNVEEEVDENFDDRSPNRVESRRDGSESPPHSPRSPNRDEGDGGDGAAGLGASDSKKPRFALQHVVTEIEQHKWSLPDELAQHFVHYAKTHVADVDMKTKMEEFPPPENIDGVVPVMSETFRSTLKKSGSNSAVDGDDDWRVVQNKILDIMGPLGVAWASCELYQNGELEDLRHPDLVDQLQKAVMLVGHALQKASWYRRLHSLSAMGPKTVKNVRDVLKESAVTKILQEDESNQLIPRKFDEHLKTKETTRKNLVAAFGKEEKKKPQTSSSSSSRGKATKPCLANPFRSGGGYAPKDNWRRDRYDQGRSSNPF